jgi:hypothetical protein
VTGLFPLHSCPHHGAHCGSCLPHGCKIVSSSGGPHLTTEAMSLRGSPAGSAPCAICLNILKVSPPLILVHVVASVLLSNLSNMFPHQYLSPCCTPPKATLLSPHHPISSQFSPRYLLECPSHHPKTAVPITATSFFFLFFFFF